MKVVVIPDKFKGGLSAQEVANNIESIMATYSSGSEVVKIPIADGGEGTSEILSKHFKAESIKILVHGPLRRKILATYYYSAKRKEAYIEMANASGSKLLNYSQLNGLITTSFGTGELIKHAIKLGAKSIILCIGGSATNDGGTGMASALGYTFLDEHDNSFIPNGGTLTEIKKIIPPETDYLENIQVTVLADVKNPLYGPKGAAFVYGPQKGLSSEDCEKVDKGLRNFASIIRKDFNYSVDHLLGSGAAGGLGGGAAFFLKAKLYLGAAYMSNLLGVKKHIKNADLIISGEGKLDQQSLNGKVVAEVYILCQQYKKPLLLIVGSNELQNDEEQYFYNTEIISLSEFAGSEKKAISQSIPVLKEALSSWISDHNYLKSQEFQL